MLTRLKSIEQKRVVRYNETILALELIYLRVMNDKKPSLKDAFRATSKIILTFMFLPEFYFLLLGISLLVFANGVFTKPGIDYGQARPILITSSSLFAGLLPLALAFVTTPFHLLMGINLWLLTAIHVVITSLAFSTIQPQIAALFMDEGIASFQELIIPIFVFYSLAEFYMLSRLDKKLSFQRYQARHTRPSIKRFIPAHKVGVLISMSSQDHYVEIITDKGRHLERMTMKKAVELVPEAEGLQVHRSHWVGYDSILGMEKTGGRYEISLRNGAKIPVGKTNVTDVLAYLKTR